MFSVAVGLLWPGVGDVSFLMVLRHVCSGEFRTPAGGVSAPVLLPSRHHFLWDAAFTATVFRSACLRIHEVFGP